MTKSNKWLTPFGDREVSPPCVVYDNCTNIPLGKPIKVAAEHIPVISGYQRLQVGVHSPQDDSIRTF